MLLEGMMVRCGLLVAGALLESACFAFPLAESNRLRSCSLRISRTWSMRIWALHAHVRRENLQAGLWGGGDA